MNKLAVAFTFAALTLAAPAQAETVNCTAITTLPYTITTQGVYCLTGHLSTGITAGAAITINANNVVLDLNGFKLGGLSAGAATEAYGIYAIQRQNITVKNGTVRGFWIGISLEDYNPFTTTQGHVIEDIRADLNTYMGLYTAGTNNVIRNNHVISIGGTTVWGTDAFAYGIAVSGPGTQILNNVIAGVTAQGAGYPAVGIDLYAASNSVLEGNRIGRLVSVDPTTRHGIYLGSGSDILVAGNTLTGMQNGINFVTATGKYMSNVTQGVATPYTGGTAAGATNY